MSSSRNTRLVFRYDDQEYRDREIITSRGDSLSMLIPKQKIVERAIRRTLFNGTAIRGSAVYAWLDKDVAVRIWKRSGKKYLYEVLVEEADILFEADLNHYNDALGCDPNDVEFGLAISRYCERESALPHHTSPRVEVLFNKGRIVRKLCTIEF